MERGGRRGSGVGGEGRARVVWSRRGFSIRQVCSGVKPSSESVNCRAAVVAARRYDALACPTLSPNMPSRIDLPPMFSKGMHLRGLRTDRLSSFQHRGCVGERAAAPDLVLCADCLGPCRCEPRVGGPTPVQHPKSVMSRVDCLTSWSGVDPMTVVPSRSLVSSEVLGSQAMHCFAR